MHKNLEPEGHWCKGNQGVPRSTGHQQQHKLILIEINKQAPRRIFIRYEPLLILDLFQPSADAEQT